MIAFPEKTQEQRVRIAKEFYKNFLDTFIETIKFLSLSDKAFAKRITGNFELLTNLYATGQNVQTLSGHFFNWEYINWGIPRNTPYPFIGVYAAVANKAFDKIILDMRRRYGSIMLSTEAFKTTFHQLAKGRYALGLAADQSPGIVQRGYWIPFFGKMTSFVTGPEKSARINNAAVVFVHFYKVKRGYYRADMELITTEPQQTTRGELTKKYVSFLEDSIRKKPSNYLWSHRRWKWEYKDEYSKMTV